MVSNTPVSSLRFFSGHWLTVARIVWMVLCTLSVVFLIIALTNLYTSWMGQEPNCNAPLPDISMRGELNKDCEAKRLAFEELGLPTWFPAVFFTIGSGLQVASWILVGFLIYFRRSHSPFEYFFSLFLVVTGTFNFDDTLLAAGRSAIPVLGPLFRTIGFTGTVLAIVVYFFPDGRLAHWSLRLIAGVWILLNLFAYLNQKTLLNFYTWIDPLPAVIHAGFAFSIIFSLMYRYRNLSGPVQRQQIKLAVASAIVLLLVFVLGFPLIYIFPPLSISDPGPSQVLVWIIYLPIYYLSRILVAGALLFSIMRYRLWDIDFIINRSIVYGTLTVFLVGIFSGSLVIIHNLFQDFSQAPLAAVAISAAAFGAFFQPTRRRLQRYVDQNFYNINIDYQKTLPFTEASTTQILRDTQLGAYKNLELIGRGGMGEVYKSLHPTLGVPVAIKVLPTDMVVDEELQQRFVREAKIATQLSHPNIVQVFEYGEQDSQKYIVMEFIDGKDVSHWINVNGKFSLEIALPILQNIASALDYAHSQGVVHRDIKPSNILLDSSQKSVRAVLTDFGIAKLLDAKTVMTHTGYMLGTFDYISPEQIQESSHVDGRADIYSLGVMAYQMLTGELPFKKARPGAILMAHMTQPPPAANDVYDEIPASVAHAIQKAMAKKPEERFEAASSFISEISEKEPLTL